MAIKTKFTKLVQNLIELRCVTPQQLEIALAEQKQTQEPLEKILVTRGFVSQETLTRLLCLDLNIEHYASLDGVNVSPDALQLFPMEFCKSNI